MSRAGEPPKRIGRLAGKWHFTLRERCWWTRTDLSLKEATAMSRDIKYIGMDVHKEAIVIAVLDGSGKLVMESGRDQSQQHSAVYPWSAGRAAPNLGRKDLGGLVARSAKALCARNPSLQSAPQCLLKGGQQERQGGCAQAGRFVAYRLAATGLSRRAWTTDAARVRAQLSDHQQRFEAGDESAEGAVSRLGYSLCRYQSLCSTLSTGMVSQDSARRRAPSSRVSLRTVGWIAGLTAQA